MGIVGFDVSTTKRGVSARLVHGIATRPKPKPKTPAAPATGQPHPPKSRDAFAKALGAMRPTLDMHGTVRRVRSSVDLGKLSSVDLAKPQPSLERR